MHLRWPSFAAIPLVNQQEVAGQDACLFAFLLVESLCTAHQLRRGRFVQDSSGPLHFANGRQAGRLQLVR